MKKIINVFISQPMTGKSEEEILATRQEAIDKVMAGGIPKDVRLNLNVR